MTNAVSTIVIGVFMGAGAIVWKGATTVDEKVQKNRQDIEHLVDQLSDKLATYQAQLTTITNQINEVLKNQAKPPVKPSPDVAEERSEKAKLQQQMYRQDIYNQLKR